MNLSPVVIYPIFLIKDICKLIKYKSFNFLVISLSFIFDNRMINILDLSLKMLDRWTSLIAMFLTSLCLNFVACVLGFGLVLLQSIGFCSVFLDVLRDGFVDEGLLLLDPILLSPPGPVRRSLARYHGVLGEYGSDGEGSLGLL